MPPHEHPAAADSARELIAAHGGRVTRTRVAVIEALQRSAHPLSHDEIGATLDGAGIGHDRVTLYRALDWLVEQGIAQRIAGGERAWRFEGWQSAGALRVPLRIIDELRGVTTELESCRFLERYLPPR